MNIGTARGAAVAWIREAVSRESWFVGAYYSGSTVGQPDAAELPPASDIDVVVVTAQTEPPMKLGKFRYRGTLLEVTYLSWEQLSPLEGVLADYHLAGSFRTDTIISDPTGRLRGLQTEVARHFADKTWVRRRRDHALQRVEGGLRAIDPAAPPHDRLTSWLFPTGITAHVLLVAALRNPTVRLRYLAARGVLLEYGFADFHEELLGLLGCAHMTSQRVARHLDGLGRTFDAAASAAKTPFFFSSDITPEARPVAIDGSRELIRVGRHREAVFWIAATYARCHKLLEADAPELGRAHAPDFHALLEDLGVAAADDMLRRAEAGIRLLPRLENISERIIAATPAIRPD